MRLAGLPSLTWLWLALLAYATSLRRGFKPLSRTSFAPLHVQTSHLSKAASSNQRWSRRNDTLPAQSASTTTAAAAEHPPPRPAANPPPSTPGTPSTPPAAPGVRPKSGPVSDSEASIFNLIRARDYPALSIALASLSTTLLPSGRNVVFTLCETSRRMRDISMVQPMLQALMPGRLLDCAEDDVMPLLSEFSDQQSDPHMAGKMPMGTVFRLVAYLQSRGVVFTAKGFSVLLKGYGRNKNRDMVERLVQYLLTEGKAGRFLCADIILLNSIMDAYIRCGQWDRSVGLLSLLLGPGPNPFRPDPAVLSSPVTAGVFTRAQANLPQLATLFSSAGVAPNLVTFNTALKAIRASQGDFSADTAEACLEVIRHHQLEPDLVTISTLIDIVAARGLFEAAEGLLARFTGVVGVEAYTCLLVRYSDAGLSGKALGVLDR